MEPDLAKQQGNMMNMISIQPIVILDQHWPFSSLPPPFLLPSSSVPVILTARSHHRSRPLHQARCYKDRCIGTVWLTAWQACQFIT
jgi:hypothetical protein